MMTPRNKRARELSDSIVWEILATLARPTEPATSLEHLRRRCTHLCETALYDELVPPGPADVAEYDEAPLDAEVPEMASRLRKHAKELSSPMSGPAIDIIIGTTDVMLDAAEEIERLQALVRALAHP